MSTISISMARSTLGARRAIFAAVAGAQLYGEKPL
jgi:hypothetical protein